MFSTVVVAKNSAPHVDALSNGAKTYTPGKGADKDGQGVVTLTAYYDTQHVQLVKTQASGSPPIFDVPATDESYDVNPGDFCVSSKVARNCQSDNPHSLKVFSSLNSLGVTSRQAFPNDPEMQRIALLNGLKYAGISTDVRKYTKDDSSKRQGVALRVSGEATVYADNDLPPGMYAQLVIPDPAKRKSALHVKRGHIPPEKVLLEVVPYNPKTLGSRAMAVLRNYGQSEENFRRGMDPKVRTTSMWINFCEASWHSALMSWAIITKSLVAAKVIPDFTVNSTGTYALSRTPNGVNGTAGILAVLKAFGALPSTGAESTTGISPNFQLNKTTKDAYHALKRDLFRKVFYDGKVRQDAFDWNNDTKTNEGRDSRGGKIIEAEPMGAALMNQINHFSALVGAFNDAARVDNEWLVGKIGKGGVAGMKADIYK